MRIAMVFPCALTRLHRSTDVSFAGAMTKMVTMNECWGNQRDQRAGQRGFFTVHSRALTRDYLWPAPNTVVSQAVRLL